MNTRSTRLQTLHKNTPCCALRNSLHTSSRNIIHTLRSFVNAFHHQPARSPVRPASMVKLEPVLPAAAAAAAAAAAR